MTSILKSPYSILPTDIPNCALWLDASDLTTQYLDITSSIRVTSTTQNVRVWLDKSGRNNHAIQNTSGTRYLSTAKVNYNTQNGLATLSFVSSAYAISTGTMPLLTNPGTYFFVYRSLTAGGTLMEYGPYATGQGRAFCGGTSFGSILNCNYVSGTNVYISRYGVASIVLGATQDFVFDDGKQTGVITCNILGGGTTTFGYVGIMSATDPTSTPFQGNLGEIIVYNSELSASNRQQVEGYLSWKWGLNTFMSTVHPFYYEPFVPNIKTSSMPITVKNPYSILATDIPGCSLWLDAFDRNSIVISGVSTVQTWRDKSGNSRNATGFNNLSYYNNLNVIMASTNMYLETPSFGFTQVNSISWFIVLRSLSTVLSFNDILTHKTNYGFFYLTYRNDGNIQFSINNQGFVTTGINYSGNNIMISGTYDSLNVNVYSNASVIRNGTSVGSNLSTPTVLKLLGGYNGNIGEYIMYSRGLSTLERQNVEGYLSWKWGLQSNLPTTHPYRYNAFVPNVYIPSVPQYITMYQYSPTAINNLALWYDGADINTITLTSGRVSRWFDKSGNNRHGYQNTITQMPLYVSTATISTFSNAVYTDNTLSNNLLSSTNNTIATNINFFSFYMVYTLASTNNTTNLTRAFEATTTTGITRTGIQLSFSGNFPGINGRRADTDSYNAIQSSSQVPINTRVMMNWEMNYGISTFRLYRNGNLDTGPTVFQSNGYTSTVASATVYTLNNQPSATMPGWYCHEMLIYNSTITTQERQRVDGYLAWKWDLQANLPTSHPFKLYPP